MADIHAGSDEQQFLAHALAELGAVEGLLKVKLIHAQGYSLLMPDLLLTQGTERWQWLQPKFFTACLMQFLKDFSTAVPAVPRRAQMRAHAPEVTRRTLGTVPEES